MVPWWNEKCIYAVYIRNKALRKARTSINFNDLINYKKKAQAKVGRVKRVAKRKYWREFCESIGEDIEINKIWGMIRKMSGIQRYSSIPVLDKENVEVLAETFMKVHSNDNIPEEMRRYRRHCIRENPKILEKRGHSCNVIEAEFTMYKLKRALSGVRKTSPGKDEICVKLIKNFIRKIIKDHSRIV